MKIRSNFIDTGNTSAQVAIGDHSHSTYALTSHAHNDYLSNTNISSPVNGQVLGYDNGVWKNITVTVADTIAPTLLSTSPLDNATGVSVGSNITMTFNEPVVAGTGNIVISNGTDTRTISVTDTTQVTISNATVTINPTTNLNGNSNYNIQMASGVIKDLNNNPYTGISNATTFNFTTADVSNPVLSSTTPVDNATNVALTSNIVMTFSEDVKAGTGNILIKDGSTTVQTISVIDTSQVSFSGTTMTINPTTNLSGNTTYNIQMASGVVQDLSNNPYAGISDTTTFNFTTAAAPMANIGEAGTRGFGVGVYLGTLPSGFTGMTGYNTPGDANYGNYQYSDGSIMVFIPKFYYRIGSTSSTRYYDSDGVTVKYGLNAVDIVSGSTYANEAAANAAGYALHRAFIDGGSEKQGFFIDKYLASKNGTTSCKSIFGGDPIGLTSNTSFNNSLGMTGCTGIFADAIVLGRSRGVGRFNCASIFQYSALAMLSLAHGQASTSTTNCAWYHATNNFPKGCNNGALSDVNDTSVVYTGTDSLPIPKPKTGATSNFNKTTHNGQACGVADLNGSMYQVMLGITQPSSELIPGTAWVLKRSKTLASLTSGEGGVTDAWGTTTSLANNYDEVSGIFPWGSTAGNVYFGNGSNQVFSGAVSGTNVSYHRTSCGIQDTTNGASDTGTNLFGNDNCYQTNASNLFPTSSSNWGGISGSGVFCRIWQNYRSYSDPSNGFRCSAYGDET